MKFRNAHVCAKHHKSFRDYELLCRLDRVKGVDMGRSYSNDKACSMFVKPLQVFPNRTLWKNYKVPNSSASQWMVALISLGMT
jgi:hypothetical protein